MLKKTVKFPDFLYISEGKYFLKQKIRNSNFAHRFCLCTLKIQYLAGIRLSKFTLCPMPPEAVSSTKQAMCS